MLINCSALGELRHTIWSGKGPGSGIPITITDFLTDRKHMRKTAEFVLQTGPISYSKETVDSDSHASGTQLA